jgi:hypothetical protein
MVGETCSWRVTPLLQYCEHARDTLTCLPTRYYDAHISSNLEGAKGPFFCGRTTLAEEGCPSGRGDVLREGALSEVGYRQIFGLAANPARCS